MRARRRWLVFTPGIISVTVPLQTCARTARSRASVQSLEVFSSTLIQKLSRHSRPSHTALTHPGTALNTPERADGGLFSPRMKRAAAVTGTFLIQKGVIQKKPLIQKPKVLVKSPGTDPSQHRPTPALTHPNTLHSTPSTLSTVTLRPPPQHCALCPPQNYIQPPSKQ